ncbi:hemagglutinin repeat-containing protein [Bordetella petrii]|nr:hemagglutinin repeat-containing protein [Bordetella petrii]
MSKFRSLTIWLVLITQVWTPVLAQTLPISVDKRVSGAKPVVGVSNGVPVVNIAPPSAGGVSNNRYIQFNVGPSGVVLNNSGGASQTQLAGQIGGNPMLGNQRATTILNQVTAPNPSRLLGTLEVAGHRANVIVANPAGITCDGCGFLNANRATLTTGRPQIGSGGIDFDVSAGQLRIEGDGLYGGEAAQVDLLARSLQINASVWAKKLNVVAGASRVDFGSGQVTAGAAQEPAPEFALDTAALGGMYANSIRLVGTEAGVGVNIGNNLVALTGDLQVSAAGDVRIRPTATLQAGAGLSLHSGSNVDVAAGGRLQGVGVAIVAGQDARLDGTLSSAGDVSVQAGRDIATAGKLGVDGGAVLQAGRHLDLAAAAQIETARAIDARAGNRLILAGDARSGGDMALAAGGALEARGNASAAGNMFLHAGGDVSVAGQLLAGRDLSLSADGAVDLAGTAVADRMLRVNAGADIVLREDALAQGSQTLAMTAARDLHVAGTTGTAETAASQGGLLQLAAGRDLAVAPGGIVTASSPAIITAARDLRLDGIAVALAGDLDLQAGGQLAVGEHGRAQASNRLVADAGAGLAVDGIVAAGDTVALRAGQSAEINGLIAALGGAGTGGLTVASGQDISVGRLARVQAAGAAAMQAGQDLRLDGAVTAIDGLTLATARDTWINGSAATDGDLAWTGRRLGMGEHGLAQAGQRLAAQAQDSMTLAGTLVAGQALALGAVNDVQLDGTAAALQGDVAVRSTVGDVRLGAQAHVQAGGELVAEAGRDLIAAGTLASGQDMRLRAGRHVQLDGIAAAQGALDAAAAGDLSVAAAGRVQADGALALAAGGALSNAGVAAGATTATLSAGTAFDNTGTVLSGGDLAASAGILRNSGQLAAGVDADGRLTQTGSLALRAGRIVNSGAVLASTEMLLAADAVDNTGGSLAATGAATIEARTLNNQAGILAAGDISIQALDQVHNSGDGTIAAARSLNLDTAELLNTSGLVSSQGSADIDAASLRNADGRLLAEDRLALQAQEIDGVGTVHAGGDLAVSVAGSLTQDGTLVAGRDLSLAVGDRLDNQGQVSAGRDLTVAAANLDNAAGAQLLAGRVNTLHVAQALNNAGLIDGATTRITAADVTNLGRIYGDDIAIQANTLLNDAGASGAAVIAARRDLDLGVKSLMNREHALIYAGGDLRVGGALDAGGRAAGQADSLVNASATIETAGDASISAASIQNLNNHFASELVQVSTTPKVFYRPEGSTDMYDAATTWLCDLVTPQCSKDPNWLGDDQERRMLKPSSKYPEAQYGPPFDYALNKRGKRGETSPVYPAYAPEKYTCTGPGGDAGYDWCGMQPAEYFYSPSARIWSVFGVTPPAASKPPVAPTPPGESAGYKAQAAYQQALAVYEKELAAYQAPYAKLNQRISAFNADFDARMVKNITIYRVNEIITESRTVSTDPGKILVGGDASLAGAVINDKSQIAAGGTLAVDGPAIQNIGATGERRVVLKGTATRSYEEDDEREYEPAQPYTGAVSVTPVELAVAGAGGNQTVAPQGSAPAGSDIGTALPPVEIGSLPLPGDGEVRTVTSPAQLPDSQLFVVDREADAPYLVATDPQFTGQRPFVSSDYLLDLLRQAGALTGIPDGAPFLTPSGQPRRLGDGFYEQKLVSDQILATTGQRFLENYADAGAQYQALLQAGADFAAQHGVQLGVALTDAQQRQLTSDLVWLVAQTVTLPDGTTEQVLVPQVYLLVRDGDLRGDGTLMAGRDVSLNADGDVANSGTIGARGATVITAENIVNQAGGRIQAASVDLNARQDLANIAALIKGDTVVLAAGNDIALTSTTTSFKHGATSGVNLGGLSQIDAGSLDMAAGRDLRLAAADLSIEGDARLQAGRDIDLGTVKQSHSEAYVYGKRNDSKVRTASEIGTTIAAGGDVALVAGQDIKARAADVTAGGQLAAAAGRDVAISAGQASGYARDEHYYKTSGFMSSSSTHTVKSTDWTQAQGSTLTGDTAVVMAGRDVNVAGSNLAAQNDLVVSADRDVNIVAGKNTTDDYQYEKIKKSGFGALGGISYGKYEQTDSLDGKRVFHTASTVGSVEGDALLNAGNTLTVAGSNVLARQGDVTLIGRNIDITSVTDTTWQREFHEIKQTGLTVTASTPLVSAMQTAQRMGEAAGKTDNAVMQGLAGATTALAAANAYDAVMKDPASAGGVSIKISLGTSKTSSTTERKSSTAMGSTVAAGRDLAIVAQGGGQASGITVTGSGLSAGNNAVLQAEGDILLQAAKNSASQKTDSKSSGASIGVGISLGANGAGITAEAGVSASRGKASGKDTTWTPTTIAAGNTLALQSGGDTSLVGAAGKAAQIVADVGGDLLVQSLQDSSRYDSKQTSVGFGASACVTGCVGGSVSANAGAGKMHSEYDSVTQQAGLWAGDGGFQVKVGENTTLVGGVIASSQQAVAEALNSLSTGTLVVRDIENRADYSASQIALGGGMGFGGGGGDDLGTTKDNEVAGGATKEHGTSVPSTGGGLGLGTPVVAAASGDARSTTQSAISGGAIEIRDEAGQQALTGQTAAEAVASVNRDTSNTLNVLDPIFDKEKIEAGFEIVSEASRQLGQFLTNRAKEIDALEDRANDADLSKAERDQAGAEAERLRLQWGPGGSYRRWMTAVMGAASGNVTGATGEIVQAAVVNYLQGLAATEVKRIADGMGSGANAEAARAALHAIVGCAGAAGGGASCGAGALGAGASSVLATLLASVAGDDLSAQEKEARSNLIQSIVAGTATGLAMDAATSASSAATELANNALSLGELKSFAAEASTCRALGTCDEIQQKYRDLSVENQEKMIALCAQDPVACRTQYGDFVEGVTDYRKELDAAFGLDIPPGLKADLAIYLYQHQEAIGVALNTEIAEQLQEKYGLTSEAAAQWAAIAAAAVGVTRGQKGNNLGGTLIKISQKQLDKKFKHASDFGISTTKKNSETLALFESKIKTHISSASTVQQGTYGFVKDSKVFFNSETNNAVVIDGAGNFVTGFKLSPGTKQFENFIKNGVLR